MNADTAVTTTADRDTLDYWNVCDIYQPIGIVPFPCGRYVCDGHQDDTTEHNAR
jgi:hypothetical protein